MASQRKLLSSFLQHPQPLAACLAAYRESFRGEYTDQLPTDKQIRTVAGRRPEGPEDLEALLDFLIENIHITPRDARRLAGAGQDPKDKRQVAAMQVFQENMLQGSSGYWPGLENPYLQWAALARQTYPAATGATVLNFDFVRGLQHDNGTLKDEGVGQCLAHAWGLGAAQYVAPGWRDSESSDERRHREGTLASLAVAWTLSGGVATTTPDAWEHLRQTLEGLGPLERWTGFQTEVDTLTVQARRAALESHAVVDGSTERGRGYSQKI